MAFACQTDLNSTTSWQPCGMFVPEEEGDYDDDEEKEDEEDEYTLEYTVDGSVCADPCKPTSEDDDDDDASEWCKFAFWRPANGSSFSTTTTSEMVLSHAPCRGSEGYSGQHHASAGAVFAAVVGVVVACFLLAFVFSWCRKRDQEKAYELTQTAEPNVTVG